MAAMSRSLVVTRVSSVSGMSTVWRIDLRSVSEMVVVTEGSKSASDTGCST